MARFNLIYRPGGRILVGHLNTLKFTTGNALIIAGVC